MGIDPNDPLLKRLKTPSGVSIFDAYHKDILLSKNKSTISPGLDDKKRSIALSKHTDSISEIDNTPKKGKSKLRNRIFKNDEGTWQSEWEYICWLQLKDLVRLGKITKLERQILFSLDHNGIHIANSVIDFQFEYNGSTIYADAKSRYVSKAQRWRWQQAMLHAFHGIEKVLVFYSGEKNIEKAICDFTNREKL